MAELQPREWLETDGLGGFAMGVVSGPRTRRYHSLLTVSLKPPTDRFNMIPGIDAWVEIGGERIYLTTQQYGPDVVTADPRVTLEEFTPRPWPKWRFRLPGGLIIEHEIVMRHGHPTILLSWRAIGKTTGAKLFMRPLMAGRDYHSMHRQNGGFSMAPQKRGAAMVWSPYGGPKIDSLSNGVYQHDAHWYCNFHYSEELARGQDHVEDLASPGVFAFDIARDDALCVFSGENLEGEAVSVAKLIRGEEQKRRAAFASPLHQSADQYIVRRGTGKTILAGYPWFTDWGRDTFIALRGLCIASGSHEAARDILLEWASVVSQGMLPNRFPDSGEMPEYNSVDASLWYIIAVQDLLEAAPTSVVSSKQRAELQIAVLKILDGYTAGTRYGIRMDSDGLIACGERGVQLTWMDAKIGDWVVTPRTGKPVEIQAMWINGLKFASTFEAKWRGVFTRALENFRAKFWNASCGWLNDIVDVDHQTGRIDARLRPNQLLAVGGLQLQLIEGEQAASIVTAAEKYLLTPVGMRTLPQTDPDYVPHYEGDGRKRDSSYHQGTVWPWPEGPFVFAWLNVHGRTPANLETARKKFLAPLQTHLQEAGLCHVSEIADADPPHTPRGCPFQAWSVGELIRIEKELDPKK